MCRSKDNVINDLAILNDSGVPGDKKPSKILNSIGRGLRIKQRPKSSEKFTDLRTGEVICADEINDVFYQSKGRGSLLGSFSKTKLQLQQQLRLARPLGSGDWAIESYYRKNTLIKNPKISSNNSEPDAQNMKIPSQEYWVKSKSECKRIIGTLNQNLYSNVLMTNLLSNLKASSNKISVPEEQDLINFEKDYKTGLSYYESINNNYNKNCSSSTCGSTVSNSSNECGELKHLEQNCGFSKDCKKNITISEVKKVFGLEGLKIIDDDEENEKNH